MKLIFYENLSNFIENVVDSGWEGGGGKWENCLWWTEKEEIKSIYGSGKTQRKNKMMFFFYYSCNNKNTLKMTMVSIYRMSKK